MHVGPDADRNRHRLNVRVGIVERPLRMPNERRLVPVHFGHSARNAEKSAERVIGRVHRVGRLRRVVDVVVRAEVDRIRKTPATPKRFALYLSVTGIRLRVHLILPARQNHFA